MKKYIEIVCGVIAIIILEYLGNLFFNWNFSFLDSLLTGICGALGYLWVIRRKEKTSQSLQNKEADND